MLSTFACPSCGSQLTASNDLPPGTQVKCPRCGSEFPLPNIFSTAAPIPDNERPEEGEHFPDSPKMSETSEKGEDEDRFKEEARPRRRGDRNDDEDYEENYDEDFKRPRRRRFGDDWDEDYEEDDHRIGGTLEGVSNQYQIDLNAWFGIAKAHWSSVVGPMIGFFLILQVISIAASMVPFVGGIINLLVSVPLNAGFIIVALAQLKGKRWSFGDFFGGFQKFGDLLLYALLTVCCFVGACLSLIPVGIIAIATQDSPVLILAVVILAVPAFLFIGYIVIRTSTFGTMLILDRNCNCLEALQGNWRMTRGHCLGLLVVYFLLGLINLGGVLLCLVGVLFTLPLTTLVPVAGYLLIAGTRPPVEQPRLHEPEID